MMRSSLIAVVQSHAALGLAMVLLLVYLVGCGGYDPAEHRVAPDEARRTLVRVLDGWRQGQPMQSFASEDPSVVVQDPDWDAGRELTAYELVDDGRAVDANLFCRVRLQLVDSAKGDREKTVTYVVTTSPVRTVFRSTEP